jgi:ribosomal protein S10
MHATKGAAYAMKARIALFFGEWAVARDAAKACMDLNTYDLFTDYATLFLSKTRNPKEMIFGIPRSTLLNVTIGDTKDFISRLAGGWGAAQSPSWELFCAYTCTDGKPIDESPLFNPRLPFLNRDPRCTATMVEFQTPWLGFMYQPHPDSLKVTNFKTGLKVTNNDNRANAQFASFNGLMWKKGIDEEWADDYKAENEIFIMRFADVLLMYCEAKAELNEIDQAMLDASINRVRARAYKVAVTDKAKYPAITSTVQSVVRKEVRVERRVEFAFEGRRYSDIIRWKMAEKVLNRNIYGMLDPADLRLKVVKPGLRFFPMVPEIDEEGNAILEPMYTAGLIKRVAIRNFPLKEYLWPIPSKEILINTNLTQNEGY